MKLFSFGSKEAAPQKNHREQLEEELASAKADRDRILKNREEFGSHHSGDEAIFSKLDERIKDLEEELAAEEKAA